MKQYIPARLTWLAHSPAEIELICAILAGVLWLAWPQLGAWPLVIGVAPWVWRLRRSGRLALATPLDAPMALFTLTAVVGLWAAYNRQEALEKFWLLLAAALLFYALANQPPNRLWLIAGFFSLLATVIAVHFLLSFDWQANPTYMAPLDNLAVRWMSIRPSLPLSSLHPNQAAGLMVALIPLSIATVMRAWQQRQNYLVGVTAVATGITLFALLLTGSRGAWAALFIATCLWLWVLLSRRLAAFTQHSPKTIFGLGIVLALLLGGVLLWSGNVLTLANRLPGEASADSRAAIFANTLELWGDFPFTGGGLASFPGLYSQYILVIPFNMFTYAHNLYLDVALEQGVLGLVAMMGMLLGGLFLAIRSRRPGELEGMSLLRWAIVTGILVMLGRGLVDDAFYSNQATPLLWLLPGFAVALSRSVTEKDLTQPARFGWNRLTFLPIFILVGSLIFPQARAQLLANLGAVAMARVELADWPTNEWADGRMLPALQPAEQLFQKALTIDPTNRTAHHRLGLIAMLGQDFETAVAHLEAAQQVDEEHNGIRKSLAYSYLWAGRLDEAQARLSDIPEAKNELKNYLWWWSNQSREDLSQQAEQMLSQLEG